MDSEWCSRATKNAAATISGEQADPQTPVGGRAVAVVGALLQVTAQRERTLLMIHRLTSIRPVLSPVRSAGLGRQRTERAAIDTR
jgi:hypothetical protein